MIKHFLTFAFSLSVICSYAFYVPDRQPIPSNIDKTTGAINLIKELSVEEFELLTDKKMSPGERKRYLRVQKKLQKGKLLQFFPERDDLTEGFQALPFFASFFTVGLVALIMVFTARDRNALKWALNGFYAVVLVGGILAFIGSLSTY